MTDMADVDLISAYKREVAPLGRFAELNPLVTDREIGNALADAFARAQMEGYFPLYTLDDGEVTPDLPPAGVSIVLLFASIQALRTQIANLGGNRTRYKAGPVEYEVETTASTLNALLADAQARLRSLRDALLLQNAQTPIYTIDAYSVREGLAPSNLLGA